MRLFISYCKKDTRPLALALTDALNALPGIDAWVDRSLRAGPSWETQIQAEILKCDYFIVLYSPDINRHLNGEEESYVLTEISYAKYTARKPIIPVMAQKTEPPITLTRAHYIDFTLPGLTVADLVEAIRAEIGGESSPEPQAASPRIETPPQPAADPLPVKEKTASPPRVISITDLLPAPFAWCAIPKGHVTIEEQRILVPAFQMAKYPITYAQYQVFIDAPDGYRDDRWWAGLARRDPQPGDQRFKFATHPREMVKWYDAMAFCRWLSDKTDLPITLPTESQWQRAAQGDDGREYPWGSDFDPAKCNTKESGIRQTTPVDRYPAGASPFGVLDMAGNVWEWCLSKWAKNYQHPEDNDPAGDATRVVRGGSWNNNRVIARAAYRNYGLPDYRDVNDGFRVVCAAPVSPL